MPDRYSCFISDRPISDVIYDNGAVMTTGQVTDKLNKMQAEIVRLGDVIGRTADGVLLCDAEVCHCPDCGSNVEGDSFFAQCWQCVGEDGGSPRHLSWNSTVVQPRERQ